MGVLPAPPVGAERRTVTTCRQKATMLHTPATAA